MTLMDRANQAFYDGYYMAKSETKKELQEIRQEISLLKDYVQTDPHTITAYTWKGMQDKVLDIIDNHIKEYMK